MEPFYTLSEASGSNSISSTTDETGVTSPSPTTHDTSRASYHISDIGSFAECLQDAADRAFPNRGRSRYKTVNVCLIRWAEDDLKVKDELDRLHDVFEVLYGFNTEIWLIPSAASQIQLTGMACNFLQKYDSEGNLFVVYYGGHGTINKSRQNQWWCKQSPDSPFVDWSSIQTLFGTAMSDVLILLDCCAAASSSSGSGTGVMESIAACGFETRAPPPGEFSFTNTLIEVLEDWYQKPSFSAAMLHTEVLFVLKQKRPERGRDGRKYEWCSTPIHLVYTGNPKVPGIELSSLANREANAKASARANIPRQRSTTYVDSMDVDEEVVENPLQAYSSDGDYKVPHVLISIALEEDQSLIDAAACRRWLADFPALAKYVNVEGIYKSYSTLVTLSLPVMIWDLLPDNPACSFIGYVVSPNRYQQVTAANRHSLALVGQPQYTKSLPLRRRASKVPRGQRSISGDSSYESGSESPNHHELVAIEAKRACLAISDEIIKTKRHDDTLRKTDESDIEADSEIEAGLDGLDADDTDDNISSDWEDVVPSEGSAKIDEKALFQRVDSTANLSSRRSLLTEMLSGSIPAAPVEIGSKTQVGRGRYRSLDQKALSPRSTRRNMLASELTGSLRRQMLWERKQRMGGRPLQLKAEEVGKGGVKRDRASSF